MLISYCLCSRSQVSENDVSDECHVILISLPLEPNCDNGKEDELRFARKETNTLAP